jgi:hypothetical protein
MRTRSFLPILLFCLPGVLAAQGNEVCFGCHGETGLTGTRGDTVHVDSVRFAASVHAGAGLECTSCHQDLAGNQEWPHPEKLKKVDCGQCHDTELGRWGKSVHGLAAEQKGDLDAAGCADCHGSHYIVPISDPRSPVYPRNLPYTCLRCHGSPSLENAHEGLGHAVKARLYLESVHGRALSESGLIISATCVSCHGGHDIQPLQAFYRRIPKICGNCHAGIYQDYTQGVHGSQYLAGNPDVPLCTDCHGEHNIRAPEEPESMVNPRQVAAVCSRCHEDMALSRKYGLPVGRLSTYLSSYHGVAMELGDLRVANCASCHGYHNIRPSADPGSSVNPANLAKTCGKCHPNAGENFAGGKIHVASGPRGNLMAWLLKRAYIVLIVGLIGGFVSYIIVDLAARRRRRLKAEAGDKTKEGD